MTLEQFAYLAQVVGVVLVIVSLVYVARQVRQNTEMARVAAGSQQVQSDFDITGSMIANRELAEIWVKGESEFAYFVIQGKSAEQILRQSASSDAIHVHFDRQGLDEDLNVAVSTTNLVQAGTVAKMLECVGSRLE